MFNWFRKQKPEDTRKPLPPLPEVVPTFDLSTVHRKLYEADGKGESVTLDPGEASELFDYLEYATYLDSMVRCKKRLES